MAMGQEAQRKPQILNWFVRIDCRIDRRIIGVSNDWTIWATYPYSFIFQLSGTAAPEMNMRHVPPHVCSQKFQQVEPHQRTCQEVHPQHVCGFCKLHGIKTLKIFDAPWPSFSASFSA